MAGNEPRERTLYEIASSFFAACVILFALAGMVAAATGDEGIASLPFAICALFLILGIGRLYLGWIRGNEGVEDPERAADRAQAEPSSAKVARGSRSPRRGDH